MKTIWLETILTKVCQLSMTTSYSNSANGLQKRQLVGTWGQGTAKWDLSWKKQQGLMGGYKREICWLHTLTHEMSEIQQDLEPFRALALTYEDEIE